MKGLGGSGFGVGLEGFFLRGALGGSGGSR